MLKLAKLWWLIGWSGLLVVAWACLTPTPPSPPDVPAADKWVHFLTYFCLGLWFFQLRPTDKWQVALALSGYGLLIEFAQQFTPNRAFEWADWVADSLGPLFAWPLTRTWLGRCLVMVEQQLGYR